jgi:hypothetical protein
LGPPQSFVVALSRRMFEVALSENALSDNNQNLYSAEPCKASQNEYNNKFVRAKKLSKKTKKGNFFLLLWRSCFRTQFGKINMAQQNINLD